MENNIFDNYNLEFSLKIYPITFLGRTELEKGDKILLPPEILKKISDSDLKGPIVFEMKNHNSKRRSHCGVMEFTADEGCAYLPRWMMQNLDVKEGEKVQRVRGQDIRHVQGGDGWTRWRQAAGGPHQQPGYTLVGHDEEDRSPRTVKG